MRIEERDDDGKLLYASRSNYGNSENDLFPGPSRAKPRADRSGMTPGVGTNTIDWQFGISNEPYVVPGGLSR